MTGLTRKILEDVMILEFIVGKVHSQKRIKEY